MRGPFTSVFVEKKLENHPQVKLILNKLQPSAEELGFIDSYDHSFGKFFRPYLLKRKDLRLYLAEKKGTKVKLAPPAYGITDNPHYYYIHSYNCIYECHYCYLQGHFKSPDLVWFVNHDEIILEMKNKLHEELLKGHEKVWFHGGEFSDSLALASFSLDLSHYWEFFNNHPQAFWELRTKSAQTQSILKLEPLKNMIISFSIGTKTQTLEYDQGAPSLEARLKAIKILFEKGYQIGIHLDPIFASEHLEDEMNQLILSLCEVVNLEQICYISLGVIRFPEATYDKVLSHYPQTPLRFHPFAKTKMTGHEGKIYYPLPLRLNILETTRKKLIEKGARKESIYYCMD